MVVVMNEYKTYEELKEELGDKFEEFMYKANIELLTKINRAIEYIINKKYWDGINNYRLSNVDELLEILKGDSNE